MRIKITISLIWSIVAIFAFFCGRLARDYPAERHIRKQQEYITEFENHVQSIGEIQQKLIDLGFKNVVIDGEPNEVTVDYIWGPITDKAYCNYMAVKSINRMAKGDSK